MRERRKVRKALAFNSTDVAAHKRNHAPLRAIHVPERESGKYVFVVCHIKERGIVERDRKGFKDVIGGVRHVKDREENKRN